MREIDEIGNVVNIVLHFLVPFYTRSLNQEKFSVLVHSFTKQKTNLLIFVILAIA